MSSLSFTFQLQSTTAMHILRKCEKHIMLLLDLSKIRQLALHSFSSLISLFHYHFKVKAAAFTLFRIHSIPFKDQWLEMGAE